MNANIASDRVWVEKNRFDQAERQFYELASKLQKDLNFATNMPQQPIGSSVDNQQQQHQLPQPNNTSILADGKENIQLPKKAKKSKKNETCSVNNVNVETNSGEASTPSTRKKNKKNQNKLAKQQQQQQLQAQEIVLLKQQKQDLNNSAIDKNAADKSNNIILKSSNKTDNTVVKSKGSTTSGNQSTLVSEIAKAREHIKNSLEKMDGIATLASSSLPSDIMERIQTLEKTSADVTKLIYILQDRVTKLESLATAQVAPANKPAAAAKDDDDDDVDLFDSEEDEAESAEAAALREKRLAAYAEKKSKKPALIAKSSLVLDIKPWDDETDLKVMEKELRKIVADGLLWGASKFVPVAYGIQKLSISCVVEDDKISIDWLTEEIEKLEDYVQSVDVAAFNKI